MTKQLTAYFDGLCEPINPGGVATYGFVIYSGSGIKVSYGYGVTAVGYKGDYATNNVAEYSGAIEALKELRRLEAKQPILRGDSRLVVKQLRGEWRVRSLKLKPLYLRAKELVEELNTLLEWIPRERNEEADRLSRLAFKEFVEKNFNEFKEAYSERLVTKKQLTILSRLGIDADFWLSRFEASKIIRDSLRRNKP